jgi:hypothetical protein
VVAHYNAATAALTSSFTLTYDAWNRLVKVESAGPTTVQTNEFDGLNRRIVRVDSGASDTYDYFYNEAWQLLEERKDGDADPLNQNRRGLSRFCAGRRSKMGLSPSLRRFCPCDYIDSLALRYYDSDTDANLAEGSDGEYYYAHDANYIVTSVINASGSPSPITHRAGALPRLRLTANPEPQLLVSVQEVAPTSRPAATPTGTPAANATRRRGCNSTGIGFMPATWTGG